MFRPGRNHRNLLDYNRLVYIWYVGMMNGEEKREGMYNTISTSHELIDIQDGYQESMGFAHNNIYYY